jgi:hypothetical protein
MSICSDNISGNTVNRFLLKYNLNPEGLGIYKVDGIQKVDGIVIEFVAVSAIHPQKGIMTNSGYTVPKLTFGLYEPITDLTVGDRVIIKYDSISDSISAIDYINC